MLYDDELNNNFNKYLALIYNAVLCLGMNEIGPVNPEEICYISFVLILSVILSVLIIGDIVSIASNIGQKESAY